MTLKLATATVAGFTIAPLAWAANDKTPPKPENTLSPDAALERLMKGNLDAFEKAAVEAALNRCRTLAVEIESELRKRPKHFVDKLSLFYASLEYAEDIILEQKRR